MHNPFKRFAVTALISSTFVGFPATAKSGSTLLDKDLPQSEHWVNWGQLGDGFVATEKRFSLNKCIEGAGQSSRLTAASGKPFTVRNITVLGNRVRIGFTTFSTWRRTVAFQGSLSMTAQTLDNRVCGDQFVDAYQVAGALTIFNTYDVKDGEEAKTLAKELKAVRELIELKDFKSSIADLRRYGWTVAATDTRLISNEAWNGKLGTDEQFSAAYEVAKHLDELYPRERVELLVLSGPAGTDTGSPIGWQLTSYDELINRQ